MTWYSAGGLPAVVRSLSGMAGDVSSVRSGWHWGEPRPRNWPEAAAGVPERSTDIGWARTEPVRIIRWLIHHGAMRPFTEVMARPHVIGSEWVHDLERPALLASNHVSHTDTALLLHALSDRTRERTVVAAAADYWYDRPMLGNLVSIWLNTFPFSRTGGPQAVLSSSSQLLKAGWNLLVYPEGTRSTDGRLGEFKPGVGFLATETGAPVIPMHVRGSHRLLPKGRRYLLPSPVTVRIGKPIEPRPKEGAREFTRRVESAVRALSEASADPAVNGSWIERWRATAPHRPRS